MTVLSAVAARTHRIGVGSAVLQIPGRTPAMTAMTAATLDALSTGRFTLGLGVSGPQVLRGLAASGSPTRSAAPREYVQIIRQAISRRRVTSRRRALHAAAARRAGQVLVLSCNRSARKSIYLAAIGPKNLDLTGRIADGWLGIFFDPDTAADSVDRIGAAATAAGRNPAEIDICVTVPTSVDPDRSGPPTWCAPTPRSTSAAWARRRRTSTTARPPRWAFATRPTRCSAASWAATTLGAATAVPANSSTGPACSATRRIAQRLTRLAAARVHLGRRQLLRPRSGRQDRHPDHGGRRRPARGGRETCSKPSSSASSRG